MRVCGCAGVRVCGCVYVSGGEGFGLINRKKIFAEEYLKHAILSDEHACSGRCTSSCLGFRDNFFGGEEELPAARLLPQEATLFSLFSFGI